MYRPTKYSVNFSILLSTVWNFRFFVLSNTKFSIQYSSIYPYLLSTYFFISSLSSSQMVDLVFLYFTFYFYFYSVLFSYFLFLEQLGLGRSGHAVTSVTTWWHSHKTDHKTWKNLVEDSRTDDVIQHRHHMVV